MIDVIVRIISSGMGDLCEAARHKADEAIVRIKRLKNSTDIENIWDNYPVISNLIDEAICEEIDSFGDKIQSIEKYRYLNKLAKCRFVINSIHERKLREIDQ